MAVANRRHVSRSAGEVSGVLAKHTRSALDCMKQLKLTHRPTFRVNYLSPALEAGLIERTVPNKPNSRLQKYRLTAPSATAPLTAHCSLLTSHQTLSNPLRSLRSLRYSSLPHFSFSAFPFSAFPSPPHIHPNLPASGSGHPVWLVYRAP